MLPQLFHLIQGSDSSLKCWPSHENGGCGSGGVSPPDVGGFKQAADADSTCKRCSEDVMAIRKHSNFTKTLVTSSSCRGNGVSYSFAADEADSPFSESFLTCETSEFSENVCGFASLKCDPPTANNIHNGQVQQCFLDGSKGSACNVNCPSCDELGGALLCRECGPSPDRFLHFYRTSYLYKSVDAGLRVFEGLGKLLARGVPPGNSSSTIASPTDGATDARAAVCSASSWIQRQREVTRHINLRQSNRGVKEDHQSQLLEASQVEEEPPMQQQRDILRNSTSGHLKCRLDRRMWSRMEVRDLDDRSQAQPKQLRDHSKVSSSFWAHIWSIAFARHHSLVIWMTWGLLSVGFFLSLNCILFPVLALFFVLRWIRVLAWQATVRRLSRTTFSADLEPLLIKQINEGGDTLSIAELRKTLGATEVLSLMESQEKLFFSMPWMAVTAFSYCETLTLPELCAAITQNLLKPREELSEFLSCKDNLDLLESLPVSAFSHPRLLTSVQRVMGRYCWARKQGFQVTQQVRKVTRKGIDLLRQQREKQEGGSAGKRFADVSNTRSGYFERPCVCTSVTECDCLMDESDVLFLVNEAVAQPLDPHKPLWQFLLLENVVLPASGADGPPDKQHIGSVVIFRIHHAVGDGISITRMFLKDLLKATPGVVRTDGSHENDSLCQSGKDPEGDNQAVLHHSGSQYARAVSEEVDCAVPASDGGSPLSRASTSATWVSSGCFIKTLADGTDASGKVPDTEQEDVVSQSAIQGVSPLKPSVSVCSIPEGIIWRVLVALRFALQLPFYAAGMAMLLRYDKLVDKPRSGSARRTSVARPIYLPLQHMKDLKERLAIALAAGSPSACSQRGECWEGTNKTHRLRITLNDMLAACVVGGYHRYTALTTGEVTSRGGSVEGGGTKGLDSCWKQDINFIIPVNLRRRDEDAKDLRNRFASLVVQMPVTPQGNSLERMREVHGALRRTLYSFAVPMVLCLERWLYATWPDLLMVFFLRLTRKISVIFSSVIGPASLPYVQRSRIYGMHFVVPQPGEVGVGVSAFSCGGNVSICVSADETVVEHPTVLRECIIAEYESLCWACKDSEPLKT